MAGAGGAHAGAPPRQRTRPARAAPADDELVRPFLVTGGRTHPLRDGLRIETIVTAPPSALSAPLRFEARRIVEVCQRPMAVVDVAVALRVPLGVAKVLIGILSRRATCAVARRRTKCPSR